MQEHAGSRQEIAERAAPSKELSASTPAAALLPAALQSPVRLLALQRFAGNSAVTSLLSRRTNVRISKIGQHDRAVAQTPSVQRCGPASACRCAEDSPGVATLQRQDELTTTTISPEVAQGMNDGTLRRAISRLRANPNITTDLGLRGNLATLLDEAGQRALATAAMSRGDIDPRSASFRQYLDLVRELRSLDREPSNDLEAVTLPGDQILVADEEGTLSLLDPSSVVGVGQDLMPVLDGLADATDAGSLPRGTTSGPERQLLLWEDGRAVLTSPVSADMATLLLQARPVTVGDISGVVHTERPWQRVRDAALAGAFRSGTYQLGTYPISRFTGVTVPPGTRIRFASPTWPSQWKFRPGLPRDTRLFEVFEPGTKRFFAWDGHAPVGNSPHPFYHSHQKGMANLFGATGAHGNIPATGLPAARGLRYARIGTRVFLIVGVAADAVALGQSIDTSIERGTPRPALAQAVRTVGSWGGAWAGAKLLCAGGALATVETGPGAVLGCIAGGVVGGFAGYIGADWIADMIEPD